MRRRLSFHPMAEEELNEVAAYYETESDGLGTAFLKEMENATQQNYLPPDRICGYFGTKKSTISAKAAEIEKACRIRIGEEGLCSPAITESLQFVELSNGMIVSKRMAREMGLISEVAKV